MTMLLERVLSKLTSFATYSDTPNPLEESVLEEDSDASVFSEDEEYEEVRTFNSDGLRDNSFILCLLEFTPSS